VSEGLGIRRWNAESVVFEYVLLKWLGCEGCGKPAIDVLQGIVMM
jgi:hypothetical protein